MPGKATKTTARVPACGAMHRDPAWLLPRPGRAAVSMKTVVFGHDPDQIRELRVAPERSYS